MRLYRFALLLLAATAATGCGGQSSQAPVSNKISESAPSVAQAYPRFPRYQIVFNPNVRADTFMLDTQKGRIWQMTQITDVPGQPSAWVDMDIIDSQGEIGMSYSDFKKQYVASDSSAGKVKKKP